MPIETEYLGHDIVEPEKYLGPKLYRVKCKCLRCGHVYYSRPAKVVPKKDPPCPRKACKAAIAAEQAAKEAEHIQTMVTTGETPAVTGAKVIVKAIDQTMNIVAEDYKMTDLKDNIRAGDTVAPALTPRQREMSKNFWGGGKIKERRNPTYLRGIGGNQGQSLGEKALTGSFLPNIAGAAPRDSITGDTMLTKIHSERYSPPVNIIYDTKKTAS